MLHFRSFRKLLSDYNYQNKKLNFLNHNYVSQCNRNSSSLFVFDIDGVFLRGKYLIDEAKAAVEYLIKTDTSYIFLTNNSAMTENNKARTMSDLLGIKVRKEQFFMAQTPLQQFTDFYDKTMLVIGGGNNSTDIIKECGYSKVLDVRSTLNRFNNITETNCIDAVDGIIILSDTDNSEAAIQSMIDLIICQGNFDKSKEYYNEFIKNGAYYMSKKYNWKQLPIFLMSTDYLWATESKYPRLTSGAFVRQFEITYENISGQKLRYKYQGGKPYEEAYMFIWKTLEKKSFFGNIKNIIFVGDNKLTDIYGANIFKSKYSKEISPKNIRTVLVSTGVDKDNNMPINNPESLAYSRYIYGDFFKNDNYLIADYFAKDVFEAVKMFPN